MTNYESTERFLDTLERRDHTAVAAMLTPDAQWVFRLSVDGSPEPAIADGRDQVVARIAEIAGLLSEVRFTDRRITDAGTGTVFVQTDGDFRTSDGRPYRNVYVFRLDWRDGRLASWEEYNNPVTITRTFAMEGQLPATGNEAPAH